MLDAFSEAVSRALKSSRFTDLEVSFRLHVTSGDLHEPGDRPVPEGVHVVPARPQLANTMTALVDATSDERSNGIGVGVCGPIELVKACRRATGQVDATSVGGIVLHSYVLCSLPRPRRH